MHSVTPNMFRWKKRNVEDEQDMNFQTPTKKQRTEYAVKREQKSSEAKENQLYQHEELEFDEDQPEPELPKYEAGELDVIKYYGGSPPIPRKLFVQQIPRISMLDLVRLRRPNSEAHLPSSTPPRILSSWADVTLAIAPFNCVAHNANHRESEEVVLLRCESKLILEISHSKRWQDLFHNLVASRKRYFEVAADTDDFALCFILKAIHPLQDKSDHKEDDWTFENFLRLAVFCQLYGIRNKVVEGLLCDKRILLETKDGESRAVHPEKDLAKTNHDKSYLFIRPRWKREAWLLIAWVFKWKKSFTALWKYFVWNSSLDEENRLAHVPGKFKPKMKERKSPGRGLATSTLTFRYNTFMGLEMRVWEDLEMNFWDSDEYAHGTGSTWDVIPSDYESDTDEENDNDCNADEDEDQDSDFRPNGVVESDEDSSVDCESEESTNSILHGYFPSAVYDSIRRTREKYLLRHLDLIYGMLEEFSTKASDDSNERKSLQLCCGVLVRGLLKVGLPLHKPSARELGHLSLVALRKKLEDGFENDMREEEQPNCDHWRDKINHVLDGLSTEKAIPEEFEKHLAGQ